MAPRLLAFDTSTEQMAVALCDAARNPPRVWVRDEAGGARASARLLPTIAELLAEAGLAYADIDGIAFGRGPGAFTGLRTSCAVAQGLGFGLGKPVLPLDSLMLVAEGTRAATGAADVWVAMDARMEEVYAGRYRYDEHSRPGWQVTVAPALYTLDALRERWLAEAAAPVPAGAAADDGGRVVPRCGSAFDVHALRLAAPGVVLPGGGSRAAALMALARERWSLGEAVDAAAALPLYLRDKVALTTGERAALRSAAAPSP